MDSTNGTSGGTQDAGTRPWAAPSADGPVRGTVSVPGSKSVTNRALVLAALAGTSDGEPAGRPVPRRVRGAARSRDTALMAGALAALGADVTVTAGRGGTVDVVVATELSGRAPQRCVSRPGSFPRGGRVDCGLAGTVMRFVPPLAALASEPVDFDGDPHARTRPMRGVLDGLRDLGARVTGDALPFTVTGPARGGEVTVDAAASSQFVSGLLLAGARFPDGLTLTSSGPVPSQPHVMMTVTMLRAAGVSVDESPRRWRVRPGPVSVPGEYDVEPDLSGAATYLAAAVATGGSVTVAGWPAPHPGGLDLQPGTAVCEVFEAFGATVTRDAGGLMVTGPERLRGVDLDLGEISELTTTAAALAALAARSGASSRLRGVAHVRGHETDRLAALATELTALGARVGETDDGLTFDSAPLHATGRPWRAYADHRMATAGALIGLVLPGVGIDDVEATTKTLPDFATDWPELVVGA